MECFKQFLNSPTVFLYHTNISFCPFQSSGEGEDVEKSKYRQSEKQKLARSSVKKQVFVKPSQKPNFVAEKTKSSLVKKEDQLVVEPVLEPVAGEPAVVEPENSEVCKTRPGANPI